VTGQEKDDGGVGGCAETGNLSCHPLDLGVQPVGGNVKKKLNFRQGTLRPWFQPHMRPDLTILGILIIVQSFEIKAQNGTSILGIFDGLVPGFEWNSFSRSRHASITTTQNSRESGDRGGILVRNPIYCSSISAKANKKEKPKLKDESRRD